MADIVLRQPDEPAQLTNASDDDALIDLWLRGRASGTQSGYASDIAEFRRTVGVKLRRLKLEDLYAFASYLEERELAPDTRKRKLGAVKSLLTFGHETGYLKFNVGAALKLPKKKNTLAQRILSEEEVLKIITLEPDPRNQLLIRLLYVTGGRVSEIVGADWVDLQERESGGQITLFGKGEKTRAVLLPDKTWRDLLATRTPTTTGVDPLFVSQKGSRLTRSQVWRIARAAGKRAGVFGVSPHWFRHSHGSHALERGAKLAVVRDTLGHASLATTNQYIHARPEESSSENLVIN